MTTTGIDTSLADFVVVFVEGYEAGSITLNDSLSNAWTPLTKLAAPHSGQLFYAYNATVGAGHTFTASQSGFFSGVVCVQAWSGIQSSSDPLESGSNIVLGNVVTGVSETAITTGDLIVMGFGGFGATPPLTIDSSFTISDQGLATGAADCAGMAYLIAPNTSAVDPAWTAPGASSDGSINGAVFAQL